MACPKPNVPNSQLKLYADKTYKKENVSAFFLLLHTFSPIVYAIIMDTKIKNIIVA